MDSVLLKLPNAKKWLEIEESNDLVGINHVIRLGYGGMLDLEQVEIKAPSNDLKEIVLGGLCSDDLEYALSSGYTIKLSLPGSDLWFDADGEDIVYAGIVLKNGYGISMTPENMQFKVNEPEYQKLIDSLLLSSTNIKNWGNFVWAVWKNGYDITNGSSTLKEAEKDLKFWCNK